MYKVFSKRCVSVYLKVSHVGVASKDLKGFCVTGQCEFCLWR